MEKTRPQTGRQKPPIAENSCEMAIWSPLFSTLLGGIPRKEWAKQEVTLGWNAEKHRCFR